MQIHTGQYDWCFVNIVFMYEYRCMSLSILGCYVFLFSINDYGLQQNQVVYFFLLYCKRHIHACTLSLSEDKWLISLNAGYRQSSILQDSSPLETSYHGMSLNNYVTR
jgi:hypothetical protein